MSDIVERAVAMLTEKKGRSPIPGVAKFVIEGEGSVMVDSAGVRAADEPADVTMTANAETFREMIEGETNATVAYMTGKLTVDGDMGLAIQLGAILA